jgi:Asp/Glu/hydantoin racemase
MRLIGITPIIVSDGELRRRQARYTELAPDGVTIELVNLKDGPTRLETPGEIRSSEDLVFEQVIRMDVGDHDGVFLDCVLDPALERLQAHLDIPVFGITNLVSAFLGSLGLQMAAVARNEPIADELDARIETFGWADRFTGVLVHDLSLEDISDTDLWNATVSERVATGDLDNVDVVINGCSAVEVHPTGGPTVLDPTALALRLIGLGQSVLGERHR